jgi:hypothetical protein
VVVYKREDKCRKKKNVEKGQKRERERGKERKRYKQMLAYIHSNEATEKMSN